jgi:hypothetical protein
VSIREITSSTVSRSKRFFIHLPYSTAIAKNHSTIEAADCIRRLSQIQENRFDGDLPTEFTGNFCEMV